MSRALALAGIFALSSLAPADTITLKDGRVLEGDVIEDDGVVIKVKMKKGTTTIDKKDVASVVEKLTPEQEYQERAGKLDQKSAPAHLELGRWALSQKMNPEAVRHFLAAWSLDASLSGVAEELKKQDYHLVGEDWQDPDTYYPSKGYLKLDGRWCAPLEHEWRVQLKEVERLTTARDAAKSELAGGTPTLRKLAAQTAAEDKKIEAAKKKMAKEEENYAEVDKKVKAAFKNCEAASKAVSAEGEKQEEGDPTKAKGGQSAAQKRLEAANAAHKKVSEEANEIAKKIEALRKEIAACEANKKLIDNERKAAAKEAQPLADALSKAEATLQSAKELAEEMKKEWEASKKE